MVGLKLNPVNVADYERVRGYAAGRGIPIRDAVHELIRWPHWGWPHGWPGRLDGKAESLQPPDPGDGSPGEAIYDDDIDYILRFAEEKRGLSFQNAFSLLTHRPLSGSVKTEMPRQDIDTESESELNDQCEPRDDWEREEEAFLGALEAGEYAHLTFEEIEAIWANAYQLLPSERRH